MRIIISVASQKIKKNIFDCPKICPTIFKSFLYLYALEIGLDILAGE